MLETTYQIPRPRVALFDIEGTICSIDFVHKTLFPYALSYVQKNTKSQWNDKTFQSYVSAFPAEATKDPDVFIAHVEELMGQDSKASYLKQLQGYIWKIGYDNGAFATSLFSDVLPFFERCKREGVEVAIFSSGSVAAQKMLLGHVTGPNGGVEDLTSLVSNYYDPAGVGVKIEKGSYVAIAEKSIGKSAIGDIVFFTDVIKGQQRRAFTFDLTDQTYDNYIANKHLEAQAAHDAGMPTYVAIREGNTTRYEDGDPLWKERTFTSFDQIIFT